MGVDTDRERAYGQTLFRQVDIREEPVAPGGWLVIGWS